MSPRKVLLCEDKYGGPFLRDLTNRLKSSGLMSRRTGVDTTKFYGACNVKLEKQLIAKSLDRTCSFTILVDSDGREKAPIRRRVAQHIPRNLATITRTIILDYEIEDWICVSLGMPLNGRSAEMLRRRYGYEKYRLVSYVPKLDFERLKVCQSFRDFVNSL
jgi:hypothetical protein